MTNGLPLSYFPHPYYLPVSLFLRIVLYRWPRLTLSQRFPPVEPFFLWYLSPPQPFLPILVFHMVCVKHRGSRPVPSSFKGPCLCTVLTRRSSLGSFIPGEDVVVGLLVPNEFLVAEQSSRMKENPAFCTESPFEEPGAAGRVPGRCLAVLHPKASIHSSETGQMSFQPD